MNGEGCPINVEKFDSRYRARHIHRSGGLSRTLSIWEAGESKAGLVLQEVGLGQFIKVDTWVQEKVRDSGTRTGREELGLVSRARQKTPR